jgi:hypothetical protein
MRSAAAAILVVLTSANAADDNTWPVVGHQGIVRVVIVPTNLATDPQAYAQQVKRLCEPGATCFINFYTNSSSAPVTLPLPDAIERESTAVFRRSAKQVAERFTWSCRLKLAVEACF